MCRTSVRSKTPAPRACERCTFCVYVSSGRMGSVGGSVILVTTPVPGRYEKRRACMVGSAPGRTTTRAINGAANNISSTRTTWAAMTKVTFEPVSTAVASTA